MNKSTYNDVFFLNSFFFSVLHPPLIRIIELCHESPVIVYFAFVTEFYVIFYYRCIKYDSSIRQFSSLAALREFWLYTRLPSLLPNRDRILSVLLPRKATPSLFLIGGLLCRLGFYVVVYVSISHSWYCFDIEVTGKEKSNKYCNC